MNDQSTMDSVEYYQFQNVQPSHAHSYFRPIVLGIIDSSGIRSPKIIDLGCGNGALLSVLTERTSPDCLFGIDGSPSGIDQARPMLPGIDLRVADLCQPVPDHPATGKCDFVVSTEVIEHLFDPLSFARSCFSFLRPGGKAIISTPYHGYLKNLALAVTGKMDFHFHPQCLGGHIKFWSRKTLSLLLHEAGFRVVGFHGAGRLPWLWKSMILVAEKPAQ